MAHRATWKPRTKHGELDTADRESLPDSVYAFPKQRKEPLTDASHVRNALARFDQVEDVSDSDREQAFANIKKAADHYGVESLGNPLGCYGVSLMIQVKREHASGRTIVTCSRRSALAAARCAGSVMV